MVLGLVIRKRPVESVRMIKGLTDSYTRLVSVGKPAGGNNNSPNQQFYIISTERVQPQQQQRPSDENKEKPFYAALYDHQSYETENVKKTPKLVRIIKKPHHRVEQAHHEKAAVKVQSTTTRAEIASVENKPLESYRQQEEINYDQQPVYVASYVEPPAKVHYLSLQQVTDASAADYQPSYVGSSERPVEVIEYIERPLRDDQEDQHQRPLVGGDHRLHINPFPPPHQSQESSVESIGFYDPRQEKVERTRQQRPPSQEYSSINSNSESLPREVDNNNNNNRSPNFYQLPPPLKNPFDDAESVRSSTEFIPSFSDDFWSVNPIPLIQYQQQQQFNQPPAARFQQRPKLEVAHTSDRLTYYQPQTFVYQEEEEQQQQRFNRSLSHDSDSTLFYPDYTTIEADRSNRGRQIAPARAVVSEPSSSPGRGVPGKDYPTLEYIPDDLRFSCEAVEAPGYYADTDTRCQVENYIFTFINNKKTTKISEQLI